MRLSAGEGGVVLLEMLNNYSTQLVICFEDDILTFLLFLHILIQGGALNRGLFFADPPPSLLGAVSGKISEIH